MKVFPTTTITGLGDIGPPPGLELQKVPFLPTRSTRGRSSFFPQAQMGFADVAKARDGRSTPPMGVEPMGQWGGKFELGSMGVEPMGQWNGEFMAEFASLPPGPVTPSGPVPPIPWSLLKPDKKARPTKRTNQRTYSNDSDEASTNATNGKQSEPSEGGDDVSSEADDRLQLGPGSTECHTLMIKHLPCRCTQQEVLDALAAVGFGQLYNFFYLPIRRGHTQNFGYAFVGFKDEETCTAFTNAMTGYCFAGRSSTKACAVAPARIQGFDGNVEHFQKTRCMRRKNRPILSMRVEWSRQVANSM